MSWHFSQEPGGGILGGKLLGWRTIGAVEIDQYARDVLLHQQRQGNLEPFPVWDDICTFDGRPWRGLVDVVSGGFPCQDISAAGKGVGISGARSGLWAEMHRIVCEVRPRYVFVENSPMLVSRGLGRVLGDLAASGYDACWFVLGAADVGAPHRRDRIWILAFDADTDRVQCSQQGCEHERTEGAHRCGADGMESGGKMDDSDCLGREALVQSGGSGSQKGVGASAESGRTGGCEGDACGRQRDILSHAQLQGAGWREQEQTASEAEASEEDAAADTHRAQCSGERMPERPAEEIAGARHVGGIWPARHPWSSEPRLGRVADGVAHRVDRLRCIGNGQVPLVAATAFELLRETLEGLRK